MPTADVPIVRRLVGCGRLSGVGATKALATPYASSRLYVNFFQPSFKPKSKTRDGARVHKIYFTPATPCDRLLAHASTTTAIKAQLKAQLESLDPVQLLQDVRNAQQPLSEIAAHGVPSGAAPARSPVVDAFLKSLSTAWKNGQARPTHASSPAPSTGGAQRLIRSPTRGRSLTAGRLPSRPLRPRS
jgi:hypothetical protein